MAGMEDFGHEEGKGDPWEFQSKPRWIQMAVLIAGPAMNFFLGFLLLLIMRMAAGESAFLDDPRVGEVKTSSPFYTAGTQARRPHFNRWRYASKRLGRNVRCVSPARRSCRAHGN